METTPPSGESGILRALIVEASQAECERLLNALRGGGRVIYARHAFTPEELSAALMEERWHVVLLNAGLASLPAGETLDTIRVTDRDVPVVLMIDRGSRFLPTELLEAGAQDFVLKSNLARLLPVVERECVNGLLRREGERAVAAVREAATALGESEARFLQLAGNIPECFWLADAESRQITYISKGYEQIWGRYVEALYADPDDWVKYVHDDDKTTFVEAVHHHPRGGLDIRFRVLRPDGGVRWLHARNFPIRDEDGRIVSIGGIASDISSFVADTRQLGHLARFDALTALPNQIAFYDRLQTMLGLSRRNGLALAVMIIDIDRFRTVNETLGHLAGDEFLRQLAGRLSGSLREGDTIGRLSGDVFAAILVDVTEPKQVNIVARRVGETLAMPVRVEGTELFATASIGIAFSPQDGDERHELVQNALTAMRRAKERGRNSVQYFAADMQAEERDRLFFEVELRNAVVRNEFALAFQPIASCHDGSIIGAEVLLRWQHPRRGLVMPDEFMPQLEETGLIVPVARWALREACAHLAAWRAAGFGLPAMSINLSGQQLLSDTLYEDIETTLLKNDLPATCLQIEVAESHLMRQPLPVTRVLEKLRTLGVGVLLDDFGSGHASLANLRHFPVDALKVDRSFVRDIAADEGEASITRAIITMAHQLKLKVIAQGVENESQLALLIAHRCDAIQGYFFSRPVPAVEMMALLRAEKTLPARMLQPRHDGPIALAVAIPEFAEVFERLKSEGHRVHIIADPEAAWAWLQANRPQVVICGPAHENFEPWRWANSAAKSLSDSEWIMLVEESGWLAAVRGDIAGRPARVLCLPITEQVLYADIDRALTRSRVGAENEQLAERVIQAERISINSEEERRRLTEENERWRARDRNGYAILQNLIYQLPWPAFGIDAEGMLALVNEAGLAEFAGRLPLVGTPFREVLPEAPTVGEAGNIEIDGVRYKTWWRNVEAGGAEYGHLLFLQREEA